MLFLLSESSERLFPNISSKINDHWSGQMHDPEWSECHYLNKYCFVMYIRQHGMKSTEIIYAVKFFLFTKMFICNYSKVLIYVRQQVSPQKSNKRMDDLTSFSSAPL